MRRKFRSILLGSVVLVAACHRGMTPPPPPPKDPSLPEQTKEQKAKSSADIHTRLAQHYIDIGNMQGALEKVTIAAQEDPTFAPAQTVMAYIYQRIKDYPNAEIHYRRAVELQPDKGDVNNNLGQFLCSEGKAEESLTYFQKALADPFYQLPDGALVNEGICQLKLNRTADAVSSFRQAVKRNPHNANALLQLSKGLYQTRDYMGAKAYLERYESVGHANAESLRLGYDIETHLGNTDAAQPYFSRLTSQFPDSEQAQSLNQTAHP